MTAPAPRPAPPRRPLPPPQQRASASTTTEIDPDDDRVPEPAPRGGYGTALAIVLILLLAMGGSFALFHEVVHAPLAEETERLREETAALEERGVELDTQLETLTAARDAVTLERDGLIAERDALRGRTDELAGAVAARDAQLAELEAMTASLQEQLQAEITAGDVQIEESGGRLAVRLADQILFAPGQAELSVRGQAVIRRVAQSLARMEGRLVQVEGHTDSTPLSADAQSRFPSNWELSTARATHVVRFLADECAIPGERLVAAGLSQYRPVGDNATMAGRRRNRRIELTLLPMPTASR
ncbi:MAG: OmpA family protein [Myxococcota bacterium]|nr:OmpA family protein [Myxococcota bacterium]